METPEKRTGHVLSKQPDDGSPVEPTLSGWQKWLATIGSAIERPVDDLKYAMKRMSGYDEPINVQLYRGYGTTRRVHVAGRVLEEEGQTVPSPGDSVWRNFVRMWKTFESDEVPGAVVRLSFAGQFAEVTADEEGYIEHVFEAREAAPFPAGVGEIVADLRDPIGERDGRPQKTRFRGEAYLPRPDAQFIVVSDVDDTVLHTDATSLLRAAVNTLFNNAYGRVAFPGVAAFYRALSRGTLPSNKGAEAINPFFYLTSSMWNVYDVMRLFFEVNEVPSGPILMRDLGLSPTKLLKGTHEEHKLKRAEELMAMYPGQRFVLIGDTGQHDAEIYHKIVMQLGDAAPQRVAAVYLRDVSGDPRDAEVESIVEQIRATGVPCVAAETSADHAQHAAEAGLIHPAALDEIDAEAKDDVAAEREGKPPRHEPASVTRMRSRAAP